MHLFQRNLLNIAQKRNKVLLIISWFEDKTLLQQIRRKVVETYQTRTFNFEDRIFVENVPKQTFSFLIKQLLFFEVNEKRHKLIIKYKMNISRVLLDSPVPLYKYQSPRCALGPPQFGLGHASFSRARSVASIASFLSETIVLRMQVRL